jgi:hypothetical protein
LLLRYAQGWTGFFVFQAKQEGRRRSSHFNDPGMRQIKQMTGRAAGLVNTGAKIDFAK